MKNQLRNNIFFVAIMVLTYVVALSVMPSFATSPQNKDPSVQKFQFDFNADNINLLVEQCNIRVQKSPDDTVHYEHNPEKYTVTVSEKDDVLHITIKKLAKTNLELFDMVTLLIPDKNYDTITVTGNHAGIGLPSGIDANFSLTSNNGAMGLGVSEGFSKNIDFTSIGSSGALRFTKFATDYTLDLSVKASAISVDLPNSAPKFIPNKHYVYVNGNGQSKITLNIENSAFSVGVEKDLKIPNPIVTYATAEDALEAVNFDAKLISNIPNGYVFDFASVIDDSLLQIQFVNDDSTISYRTAKTQDDITGVYTKFPDTKTLTIGDTKILLLTTGQQVNIATWNVGGIAYSLYFEQPAGTILPMDAIELMISSVL